MTDGPVGCTLEAQGLPSSSPCATLSGCAILLKHISASNTDDGLPPVFPPT